MTAHPEKPAVQQNSEETREKGSSAPTWEYGAPDLGIGQLPRTPRRDEVSE